MKKSATICGNFRYSLSRDWGYPSPPSRCLFVMLNPSTADANYDDATIRKCIGFALKWEYSAIDVVNLYAFRTVSPKVLKSAGYPIGTENNHYINHFALHAGCIVLAWGNHGQEDRVSDVLKILSPYADLFCLGKTKSGAPKHPLMLSYFTQLELYS